MKRQIRILGIDDSPFTFSDKFVNIIGVIMRGGEYLEGVLCKQLKVDGIEATSACIDMVNSTKYNTQLKIIMIDGVSLGGFNIINIKELYESTNIPVVTITRDKPNLLKIKTALEKNFKDWEKRWNIISDGKLHKINTLHNPIFVKFAGINTNEVEEIIKLSTIRGVIPEPIRIAHLIASGITRGESYGKA